MTAKRDRERRRNKETKRDFNRLPVAKIDRRITWGLSHSMAN